MKCELKYTIEKVKTVCGGTTIKELVVVIPISIIIALVMNYFIGCIATLLTVVIIYMGIITFTLYKAVKYCRRRSND